MTQSEREQPTPGLALFLRRARGEILRAWADRARELGPAHELPHKQLVDHLPLLIERVAEIADELAEGKDPALPNKTSELHAVERLEQGFDLPAVVSELSLLRDCILRLWHRDAAPAGIAEARLLDTAIDRAIAASVERYVATRDRTMSAIDQISSAALESGSVDELLRRLLATFIEATPAADGATIFLLEGDRLHARASVGLESEVERGFSLRVGEGFAGRVAADRAPRALRSAATDPNVISEEVHARGVRALYGAPLIDCGEVLGVAYVGSHSAPEFSEQDKRLFGSMTNRAAAAVKLHRLREVAEARARDLSRLEQLVSTHPDMFYVFDRRHRFVFASPSLQRLLRRSLDEIVGKDFEELGYPAELVALHRDQLDDVLAGDVVHGENAFTDPGGRTGYYAYIFTPIRDARGEVSAIAGVTRDITDRRRAEEALEREVRAREEVVAVVSHDLRNPLGAIAMSVGLLRDAVAANARLVRLVETVRRSAERMERLVGDLLDTASIRSGRLDVKLAPREARAVVDEVVETFSTPAHEKGVRLQIDVRDGALVRCDFDRTVQVLANLVGNAMKFCEAGDSITVRAQPSAGAVEIAVIDTGPGIAPEELPHLFEPYWVGREHAQRGTGLGLYISKGIVEAQGGALWVESAPGKGTTFRFTLPRA